MKKKLKADSVDELFEIVKAVQNGEDPEEYAKRKRREALEAEREAEEAEKRKRQEERERAEAVKRKRREEREKAETARRQQQEEREQAEAGKRQQQEEYEKAARLSDTGSDEEDFERLLEEDSEEGLDGLKSAMQQLRGSLGMAAAFLGEKGRAAKEALTGWKENLTEAKPQTEAHRTVEAKPQTEAHRTAGTESQTEAHRTAEAEPQTEAHRTAEAEPQTDHGQTDAPKIHIIEEQPSAGYSVAGSDEERMGEDRTRELGRVHLTDIEKEPIGKTRRRYGAKSVSEESETIGKRILHSLHMDPVSEEPEEYAAETRDSHTARGGSPSRRTNDAKKPDRSVDEIDADSIDLDTVQILDRLLDVYTTQNKEAAAPEQPQKAAQPKTISEQPEETEAAQPKAISKQPGETETAQPKAISEQPEETETAQPNTDSVQTEGTPEPKDSPAEKTGILHAAKKRAMVLCSAAAAIVLVVAAVSCMVYRSAQIKEKQKYVTAEEGLTITVENQPAEWCQTCELTMKISVKNGESSSIEIDGTAVEPNEKGYVTVEAQKTPLEVTVTTAEKTLTASVEIPMLDSDAPVVTADLSGGQITLTATDARSGVAQIRYAVVKDDDWLQLPQYQNYSEPIAFEEDCLYYFYAVDQAGNSSSPAVSNMVTAQSFVLSESELTLYPESTAYLTTEVTPSDAILTNLKYESSNTDVALVNSSGLVTAVAEGSALIKATADGVDMATCIVNVVQEAVITVSAIGDCTLGTYKGSVTSTNFDTYYSMYGASWFFQNVSEILSNDDLTFANLEGPLTDSTNAADKTYAFKGDPSYTEILQDGSIEVVTLANNHSSDYGSEGLSDTKENLTAAGIDYCTGDTIAYQEISGVKIACIGIYELPTGLGCETQVRETIAEAQSEGAQLIIVAFHWGTEKENYADEIQQSLAHTAIDCGADLVVGHHPHVLQGIEKYNGKYIVYSLGNFCFGGNANPSDKDTMIFRQTFTIGTDGAALDDAIEIIPCTISSASGYNDYCPTPATGSAADEIMERINEYSEEFGDITYTASTGL
ncbi:MAG: CapA family protein [Clostridiales bacterium]|nr:CapA family protein [Clostridiales bacterium]